MEWENKMTEQTVTKQSHAALLCCLAWLAGWMVVSGAATGIVTFLWDCLTTSIIWFIT